MFVHITEMIINFNAMKGDSYHEIIEGRTSAAD